MPASTRPNPVLVPVLGLAALAWAFAAPVQAQDYIDVEGERAAPQPAASEGDPADPYDPYRVRPAQAYPTTSFGAAGAAAPATTASGGQDLGNLLFQLQQLQQEVMMLNGRVEEQAFEIERLKTQLQERYVDLDRRIMAIGGGAAAAATAPSPSTEAPTRQPAPSVTSPPRGGSEAAAEQPGEGEAYRAAYALVRGQQWDAAIQGFNQFLQDYPAGRYAPNAHYWLGELYLVTSPPQLESSRQSFMLLLSEYPDNNKVPDALYKLGRVYFQKGNPQKGREYLDRVINEYGDSNSTAVRLARDFIKENY